MNDFIENALRVLNTAENAMGTGHRPTDFTILIGDHGASRMIADSDWPLQSLRIEHGARAVYRVRSRAGSVQVDGEMAGRSCQFSTTVFHGRDLRSAPIPNHQLAIASSSEVSR
ncbi:MAG: hypothetical protein H7Y20_08940 [Bryobacteraceae bacterium]|nr:hypothetical protein [Bryobacteraceae bacterium]